MIPYLLHVSILLAGCYIFYWLLLRQETFFQLNRGVLIACLILPMILPLISIPAAWSLQFFPNEVTAFSQKKTLIENENLQDEKTILSKESPSPIVEPTNISVGENNHNNVITKTATISFWQVMTYLYLTGVGIFVIAFIVQLILILAKMSTLNSMKDGKYRIVELVKDEAPYSFWNTIFINPAKYDFETYEQILAHEKIHIDQTHFLDKLLVEVMVMIFWFNPFVWFFRKAITNNLEFLTDQSMLTQGFPKQSYQMSLLKVSVPQHPLNLTTNYNQSFLKNRIAMMNSKKSSARSIWKYLFILPFLGFSVLSLNAVDANTINEKPDEVKVEKTTPKPENSIIASDSNTFTNSTNEESEAKINSESSIDASPKSREDATKAEEDKLKNELLSNLRKDNLLTDEDPVFKYFPDKILLNEKPLKEKLRKKYARIFEKYGLEPNVSRLLVMTPVVIMSGSFVGNENATNGSHVDIFDEGQDLEGSIQDRAKSTNINVNKNANEINNVNINKNSFGTNGQNSRHVDGQVSVHTENGRTYVQGQGTHHINGQVIVVEEGETKVVEDEKVYTLEENDQLLTSSDKRYLEESKGKGHLDWVGYGKTAIDKKSNYDFWRLPKFCKILKGELTEAGVIQHNEKILLYFGSNKLFVNGKTLRDNRYEKIYYLAKDFDMPVKKGWNMELDGQSVIVVDNVNDVDQLREDLLVRMLGDNLIKKKNEKITLKIYGNRIIVNGKDMPVDLMESYAKLFQSYRIVMSPGKEIWINHKRGKKSISVGYGKDKTFLGTFSME